jgi:deoxycytidylate deaminase
LNPKRFFKIASQVATAKDDLRSFKIGALAIRSDEVIVCSANGPVQIDDCIYKGSCVRASHAEMRLCNKLDVGSVVFVVRIRPIDGKYGLARPCSNCLPVLLSKGVSKVYYTIDEFSYGIIKVKGKKVVKESVVFKGI